MKYLIILVALNFSISTYGSEKSILPDHIYAKAVKVVSEFMTFDEFSSSYYEDSGYIPDREKKFVYVLNVIKKLKQSGLYRDFRLKSGTDVSYNYVDSNDCIIQDAGLLNTSFGNCHLRTTFTINEDEVLSTRGSQIRVDANGYYRGQTTCEFFSSGVANVDEIKDLIFYREVIQYKGKMDFRKDIITTMLKGRGENFRRCGF